MARGGYRTGAGRKRGSKNKDTPKIRDYINESEVKELVDKAKEEAKNGRPELLKFLLEQIFGKAPQSITGPDGGELVVLISGESAKRFNIETK